MTVKVATVNVNGIRAAFRKGMAQWLADEAAEIVLLQEVRADKETTVKLFGADWELYLNESSLKGRAGVGIALAKSSPWKVTECNADNVAVEVPADGGRWLEVDLQHETTGKKLKVVSVYLHSGELGSEKQTHKMAHLARADQRFQELLLLDSEQSGVIIAGDYNIVHTAADIKNWKPNHNKRAGVLDEEIAYLDKWFELGWIDAMRSLNPDTQGPYSWWSNRGKAFDNDAGWRIDYQLVTPKLAQTLRSGHVARAKSYEERFSDHAPVVVEYDF